MIIFITVLSCSSDDGNNSKLIGKWEFDKTIENGVEYDDAALPGCDRNYFELKDSGIKLEIHHTGFPEACSFDTYTNNYFLENNIIKIINSPESTFEMKILLLTSTTLKVSIYDGEMIKTFKRIE